MIASVRYGKVTMMSDYISRQAALEAVNDCGICIQRIVDIPTADIVEVVRCKDCKHWDAFDIHSTICPNNRRCKGIFGKMYTAPDYYCAYGERK